MGVCLSLQPRHEVRQFSWYRQLKYVSIDPHQIARSFKLVLRLHGSSTPFQSAG
jgi:hypothetical protein